MSRTAIILAALVSVAGVRADQVLYQYEGNVLPYDAAAGWEISNPCEQECTEGLADGVFFLFWATAGDFATYAYRIAVPPEPQPPTLWVEWRFRSNHPIGQNSVTCGASFFVRYEGIGDWVNIFGDAVLSAAGNHALTGLNLEDFHTQRFESLDGVNYSFAVDGNPFHQDAENQPTGAATIGMIDESGCGDEWIPDLLHEWDYVRYGTISYGEQIVSSDPPQGDLNQDIYGNSDRFTVTFDAPNYVYLNEITVTTTGGVDPPVVLQTRRGDNFAPDTVEIVLDRPLPPDQQTTFTFDDGTIVNEVVCTLIEPPPIPTTSSWGMLTLVLAVLVAATVALRPRVVLQLLHR